MANNPGMNDGTEKWVVSAMLEKEAMKDANEYLRKKKKELEKINETRKYHRKRPLTLEEYLAIGATKPARKEPAFNYFSSSKKTLAAAPSLHTESYETYLNTFLTSIDRSSEVDIISHSKFVFFHHFTLDEFKRIVNKAAERNLTYFLDELLRKLSIEASRYALETGYELKLKPFESYVKEKIASVEAKIKENEERAAAAAAAAALKAEAEAAAAEKELARIAAEISAREKSKADDPYRKLIVEFMEASEKEGRAGNAGSRTRAAKLRKGLTNYNEKGEKVKDGLTKKMMKSLAEKGFEGGKRNTRKNTR